MIRRKTFFNITLVLQLSCLLFCAPQVLIAQGTERYVICERRVGTLVVQRRCRRAQTRITGDDLRQPGAQGPQGETGPQGPQGIPGSGPAFSFSGSTDFDEVDTDYKFYPIDAEQATGVVSAAAVEPDSPLVNAECSRVAYRLVMDDAASPDGVVIMRLIRLEPFEGGIDGGDSFVCSISSGSKVCSGETTLASPIQPGDRLALTIQHPGALTTFSAVWNISCIDHLES